MKNQSLTGAEALTRLEMGNASFVSEKSVLKPSIAEVRELCENGQSPFATIITCSDSRVSPEIIFSCGLGSLFVIRTAGNVLGVSEQASAEYAAEHLKTPLIVIMGHSHCGAVQGAMSESIPDGNLGHLLSEIRISVEQARRNQSDCARVASLAEDLNIERGVKMLKENKVISQCSGVCIMGAKYDTLSGHVTFF